MGQRDPSPPPRVVEVRDTIATLFDADDAVRATQVNPDVWALDFPAFGPGDIPFDSSATFDVASDEITGAAIRFSPQVLHTMPDDRLRDRLEGVLDRSDPPGGSIYTTYLRGDAQVTGPHILAPGGFSAIDPMEFADWVGRVNGEFQAVFGPRFD